MITNLLRNTPSPLKSLLRKLSYLVVFSDFKSLMRFYRIDRSCDNLVKLQIRNLNGISVEIRSHSTDPRVVFSTFVRQFHVPPRHLVPADAKNILDSGSNIGLTIAHFSILYPSAKIIGVEMDEENASLCRKNIQFLKVRAKVINAAIWIEDGTVEYDVIENYQDGLSLVGGSTSKTLAKKQVDSIGINSLISAGGPEDMIDLVKMDIKGAEANVLKKNTECAGRVKVIMVECHPPYTREYCRIDLERLGFKTSLHKTHADCVIGEKR